MYSLKFTLSFICDHDNRYSVIPMVTYDKPIWWKARTIIENEPESSDLRQIV